MSDVALSAAPLDDASPADVVLQVSRVHFPVTTLGYGRRVGIWTQGCSIRCAGCISRDTWAPDPARAVAVEALVASLTPWLAGADGVTISGGEPFDQPAALAALLPALRAACAGDLLVYSGHSAERLEAEHVDLLAHVDVLISDPYVAATGATRALRGSDNQRLWRRTPLARTRYPVGLDQTLAEGPRRLDVHLEAAGDTIWMAGIPGRGDLARLRAALAARGLSLETSQHAGDDAHASTSLP